MTVNLVRVGDQHHRSVHKLVHVVTREYNRAVLRNVFLGKDLYATEENGKNGVEEYFGGKVGNFLAVGINDDKSKQE